MRFNTRFIYLKYIYELKFELSVSVSKSWRPAIYVFYDDNGLWYWDFKNSFLQDAKAGRDFRLFGPFKSQTEARADWLKGCKTHKYQAPSTPIIMWGRIDFTNWSPIYGDWETS